MEVFRTPIPWQECEFVSMANAARIAGRSHGWVRECITAGELSARRLPTGGPPVVSVASLRALLRAAGYIDGAEVPAGRRPALRLVTSNE